MLACLLALLLASDGPPLPLTAAEASGFKRTSTHAEVLAFLDALQRAGAGVAVERIGTSAGGRPLPLAIAADPPVATPAEAARTGRPVVFVQANIHAGEVEGKEASLMLLRELTLGSERELLRPLVLLVVPNYNPDGNDQIGRAARHRPGQDGPDEVGVRANGQGLDLNRDYMKAESLELRAVLERVFVPWDPDLFVDLHTTNGSHHGYALTYAPPLFPVGGASPGDWVRDRLLPAARAALRERAKLETFDYGDFDRQAEPKRWETFDWRPRYGTNYAGLRGRMAVLSEAYSYSPFETRVRATQAFVREVLAQVGRHAAEVRRLSREMDERVRGWGRDPAQAPPLGLRCRMVARGEEEVLWEGPDQAVVPRKLPVHDRFEVTRSVPWAAGFLLPPSMGDALALARRHGIVVEKLSEPWTGAVEVFTPTKVTVAGRVFQGHRLTTLEGRRAQEERTLPAGSWFVAAAQPLGLLVAQLLDPETEDGWIAWGLAGLEPHEGEPLPYFRVKAAPAVPRTVER